MSKLFQSPNDQRSVVKNPNNLAFRADRDNRSRQLNPQPKPPPRPPAQQPRKP